MSKTHGSAVSKFSSFLVDSDAPLLLEVGSSSVVKHLGGLWDTAKGPPRGLIAQYLTSGRVAAASLTCKVGLDTIIGSFFPFDDFQTVTSNGLFIDAWGDTNATGGYSAKIPGAGAHIELPLSQRSALQIQLDGPSGSDAITIDQFYIEWWY